MATLGIYFRQMPLKLDSTLSDAVVGPRSVKIMESAIFHRAALPLFIIFYVRIFFALLCIMEKCWDTFSGKEKKYIHTP